MYKNVIIAFLLGLIVSQLAYAQQTVSAKTGMGMTIDVKLNESQWKRLEKVIVLNGLFCNPNLAAIPNQEDRAKLIEFYMGKFGY